VAHLAWICRRRLLARFQVWNVVKGQQVLGQQYGAELEDMPRVPHVIAAEIFRQLTR
jgi:Tol biopolymer transport system component